MLVLPFWQLTQIRTLNCGPLTHRIMIKHSFFVAINFFFLALMFSVILVPTIADLQPKLTFDFDCLGDLLSQIFIRMVHGKKQPEFAMGNMCSGSNEIYTEDSK